MIGKRAADFPSRRRASYPETFQGPFDGRVKRALGEAFGLDQFGVNLVELEPGAQSALRHWHSREDEFVYILEGEATLVTDAGAETLGPGEVAGFKAGVADGHHLRNDGEGIVRYLEIGARDPQDACNYPDDDLHLPAGRGGFTKKDGTPYE